MPTAYIAFFTIVSQNKVRNDEKEMNLETKNVNLEKKSSIKEKCCEIGLS